MAEIIPESIETQFIQQLKLMVEIIPESIETQIIQQLKFIAEIIPTSTWDKQHLEFLSLKGGCTGSSKSTLVKMPHCWKSCVAAQIGTLTF